MRLAGWNCRGLGNGPAVRGLLDFQKQEDPDVLFICETKMVERNIRRFKWLLGMHGMVARDCEGRSGGIVLFWKKEVNIKLRNYSRYHIDVEIVEGDGFRWRFTGIYGEPAVEKRDITWKLLRILNQQTSLPWLCMGDFNEILFSHEKKGGAPRSQAQMDKFRWAIEECGLRDLGFSGDKFTWRNNSWDSRKFVKERLDRALGSRSWCKRFPAYKIVNGDQRHSDHRPLLVMLGGKNRSVRPCDGVNYFRFEAKWLQEEGCEHIVNEAWNKSDVETGGCLMDGLKKVASSLKEWDSNVLGDLQKRIKEKKRELEIIRRSDINPSTVAREHVTKEKLRRLEDQLDTFWKQRAHVKWLRLGDRNTSFFHAFASERKKRNKIEQLQKEDGSWVQNREQLKEHVADYFFNLFSSTAGHDIEEVLRAVPAKVDMNMNEALCAHYSSEEIKAALDNIGDLKAPGLDGMPAIFYKRFWGTVGDQVTKEALNVLRGGAMPEGWNNTLVILIPKTRKPKNLKELRPISLCNVVYKVVSKNKRIGASGYAALKLDMSKAYDRVEWNFLEGMLLKLGFRRSWVNLIMKCVSTVRYQIKVNNDVTDIIIPRRGLRQGDPLSPYLFLICAEGFSSMLHEAELNGRLREAEEGNAREIQRILDVYEKCSGQVINREKSSVLFSKNTKQQNKEKVKTILKFNKEGHSGKYLGLPVYIGKSKRKTFAYLKERIWKCIQGWKEKLLSKAGKEILIKAVAQAIPVYAMACFDLTKSFCDQLSTMICRYWWSQMEKDNTMHWVSWERMTLPKSDGGLGFRNLHHFNIAMLARQAWRLLKNPDALCARVLSAKYYPDGQILNAKPVRGMSYAWRSILKGIDLLNKGIIWRVGNGRRINIWTDPWIPRGLSRRVMSRKKRNLINRVEELIDPITNTWDVQLLNQSLEQEDVQAILQIPVFDQFDDFPAWHYDKKGLFSVKSAYKVARDWEAHHSIHGHPTSSIVVQDAKGFQWKKLWSLPLPNKVLHFLWRVATNSLPMRMKLKRRGMEVDTRCPLCFRFNEDGGHAFCKCKMVKPIWRKLQLEDIREKLCDCPNVISFLETILNLDEEKKLTVCCILWIWWSERNKANVGDKIRSTQQEASHTGGWGFIMRNDRGVPVAAGHGHIQGISSALQAEATALLQAVRITSSMGCSLVQLEMDATVLKKAITSQDYDLSPLGSLFREIKSLLCIAYDVVKISVCKRSCNFVAHELAARGALLGDGNHDVWVADLPQYVLDLCAGSLSSNSV